MVICQYERCVGCALCVDICNVGAISMENNHRGFSFPSVDTEKCLNCKMCITRCPQNSVANYREIKQLYAAFSKNDDIRKNSASGGLFAELAEYVLKKGGTICGAAFDSDMKLKHIFAKDKNNLKKICGTKYLQSDTTYCYSSIKKLLDNNETVLFSGTPCQVDALYRYLKDKDYDNLITVDLICHGVPSPKVLEKLINSYSVLNGERVVDINFRNKFPGWRKFTMKMYFSSGKELLDNSYIELFWRNLTLRDSCYTCKYVDVKRIGDITLGDFWGYKESAPEYIENDDLGISFCGVNTKKGEDLLYGIKKKLIYTTRKINDAVEFNPALYTHPVKPNVTEQFWNDLDMMTWNNIVWKYIGVQIDYSDWMSKEDREYFSIPYKKRHFVHKLRKLKNRLVHWMKGR